MNRLHNNIIRFLFKREGKLKKDEDNEVVVKFSIKDYFISVTKNKKI